MVKILIVEDEVDLNKTVSVFLGQNGYSVTSAFNSDQAFDILEDEDFDLIISDVMMPGTDGIEFAKQVHEFNKSVPILLMTALDDFNSKKKGFEAGIDDYMVKPVLLPELEMRIKAILRRVKIATEKKITIGDFVIDAEEFCAYWQGEQIMLTVKEFNLLYKMLSYPKKTFTRYQLMSEFWESEKESSPRVVDVFITKIREKLSACTSFSIVTVHGLGYKVVLK